MTSPPSKRDKDNVPKRTRSRKSESDEDIEALRGAWSGAEVIPDNVARKLQHRKAKPKSPRQIYNEAIESVWTESGKAE